MDRKLRLKLILILRLRSRLALEMGGKRLGENRKKEEREGDSSGRAEDVGGERYI